MSITAPNPTTCNSNDYYSQMAELTLFDNNVTHTLNILSATAVGDTTFEGVANLFDGNVNTKACCKLTEVAVTLNTPVSMTSYQYMTGNDGPCRDPEIWTMEVKLSADASSPWVLVDSQNWDGGDLNRHATGPMFNVQSALEALVPTVSDYGTMSLSGEGVQLVGATDVKVLVQELVNPWVLLGSLDTLLPTQHLDFDNEEVALLPAGTSAAGSGSSLKHVVYSAAPTGDSSHRLTATQSLPRLAGDALYCSSKCSTSRKACPTTLPLRPS